MTINHPSFVGFDRLFDQIDRMQSAKTQSVFPPHNIIMLDKGGIILELSVAGYSMEDLEIVQEKDMLTIKTVDDYVSPDADMKFAYKGISSKKFRKAFTVADNVEILAANLENGILSINMQEVVPEEDQPKIIKINHNGEKSDPKFLTE